jgi:8-oxo-dGTP pyrophosphatase MutT (NUDIX family)
LTRELKEELGYEFHNVKVVPIEKFTSDNGHFSYHTFLIPITEEFTPILNDEHRGYCWVCLEDHPKPLHPGVWRTINFKAVMEKIKTLETIL